MTNQQDIWNNQQRPLGQQFNRQHPPVLPPPATLETGGGPFYTLPSLPSLGNGAGHPQPGPGFNIPSINPGSESIQVVQQPQGDQQRQKQELRRPSNLGINNPPVQQHTITNTNVPPVHNDVNSTQQAVGHGIPNRSSVTNVYRPLNVKDALSYLDQVKIQFYNQADVYNNFLDIMKDFKSQSIDTPGVIDRVSTLFKGHPNLIQGFNTFLPPGYRIECSLDPSDPNPIRVTTPTGTTTRPNINTNYNSWGNGNHEQQNAIQEQQAHHNQQQQLSPEAQLQQEQEQQANGGQIEFNHAISYVNKIKTRFANQPDIYKQFLEILQTYQREQKPISEVYEQVTVLFANSQDLLDDFKQFLPDTSNQGYLQQHQIGENGYYGVNGGGSQLPPVGSFQPPTGIAGPGQNVPHNGQGYPIAGVPMEVEDQVNDQNVKKKSISEPYAYDNNYNQEANYSNLRTGVQPYKGKGPTGKNGMVATQTNPTLIPGVPEPVLPYSYTKSSSLLEEINFFDKVKKAIGNKQTYNEFLKILNLFSQEIIDKATLVQRVEGFIGETHNDLFNWFKMFVGYEEKPQYLENITFKKHQLELSLCKAYGPSYRQLPKAETYMPCSGRDEMCWEVLNDEWVGHPTWASEDSGFIAHRKNQYEEILFKIEEERLEFDYYMEANLRTIQTLETIANRIANMTPEQKANFKLPPGLGHNSETIYKKVIRKIYDKERGFEVIDALHENPSIAVPIVLKRLKQKDEEWKRSHREWNKVWREMEQKVFHKSLDHLGLTFKQADKKLLTAKQLVSEISSVKTEQQNKRLHPLTPKPQEQLHYQFEDMGIILDIVKLADVFIYRSSNYSAHDREKLSQFMQSFISLIFNIPGDKIKASLDASKNGNEDINENDNHSSDNESSAAEVNSKKRHREDNLLRDVLKKQSKSKKEEVHESPGAQNDSDEFELNEALERSSELWIKTSATNDNASSSVRPEPVKRDKYNLFCNTTIYVFVRHLRTLYERLENIKSINEEVGKEIRSRTIPQFAKDLNLESHQLEDMGIEISGNRDCYTQVLSLAERLIEGEIEHQWYEESLRQGYRNKAYQLYTVDKVVQAMVKHMHTMVTDSKTSEMMVLFESDRAKPVSSAKEQILYRLQVRSLMSVDENMFKIVFRDDARSVMIEFVSLDDLTINDHETAEEEYNYYVTSYLMSYPTEGVPISKINMPFLKSYIEKVEEEQCEGVINSALKVSVCQNSYRLFFENGTHDGFTTNMTYNKQPEDPQTYEEKVESFKKLINDSEFGWKRTLGENEDKIAAELENNIQVLFKEGASAYLKLKLTSVEKEEGDKVEEEADVEMSDPNKNNDHTIDADATAVHENNDTTIQQEQDGNDTTTDETTVNQEEASFITETQT